MELHLIRNKVRESLSSDVFQPQPMRGIVAILLIPVFIGFSWFTIHYSPPWYLCLLISIIIGQIYLIWDFIGHEALHGSIFKSSFGQHFLGYLGYTSFLISPLTWKFWHCQCHHGYTNFVGRDPDFVGTIEAFSKSPITRLRAMFNPGIQNWMSYIGFFCGLTLQGQYMLWFYEKDSDLARKFGFNRLRAKIETILMILFWSFLGVLIGAQASLYIIILPMAIANFSHVTYIVTQHFLRPTNSDLNNPLRNTISVTAHPIIDFIHLNGGYHVEHHLFPSMSPRFAPLVSQVLREHFADEYVFLPYFKVLLSAIKTPRIYFDSETLINPSSGEKTQISDVIAWMTEK
ncbi:fatty acid desaturase family protein [Nostoc sp.]|uniref:fatty acid desaturase family protein n=1 Tax=Nostoc sp. TaxID=1180 RepID=UPI002FF9A64D